MQTKLFKQIKKIFQESHYQLYLVGGAVRDKLLKRESKDIDLGTNARPKEMLSILREFNCKHIGFGTIAVYKDSETIEITTFRKIEKYSGVDRIPEVVYGDCIDEDLERRDFTINAMAIDLISGKLIDPYFGESALKNRQLRIPKDDKLVLREDPLRMLRAARFISELGFEPSYSLVSDAIDLASHILFISRERWLMEMDRILLGNHVKKALDFLVDTKIINFILPEVIPSMGVEQPEEYHHKDVWEHTKDVVDNCPKNKNLRWAALLHDLGKPRVMTHKKGQIHFYRHEEVSAKLADHICGRFRMSNQDSKEIIFLVRNHLRPNFYSDKWRDSAVRRFVLDAGDYLANLLALSTADITSHRVSRVNAGLKNLFFEIKFYEFPFFICFQ
ncbi:unnamed protein product [marine sediment metagenome]|uniref:HD domain-containing protein n=1 Tax=marine sediment metagenome TaxID=412755 RepID=X1SXX0_9ZZZZ